MTFVTSADVRWTPHGSQRVRRSRWLIVHADDFGLSEAVNAGIVEAYRKGILTSTSIMAVGRAFDQAANICRCIPDLDTGVHLTLIEERPVLPPTDLPSLIGEGERLHRHAMAFTQKYFARKINMAEVYRELDAQIARVRDSGVQISHLDSHQHLHMLPGIFDVTLSLAKKHEIPGIRIPHEGLTRSLLLSAPSVTRVLQQIVLNSFCYLASRRVGTLRRADHFAGFMFGGALAKQRLEMVLRNLPPFGSVELMCHPSMLDPENEYGHWGYHGAAELEALIDPSLPGLLDRLGIELISYRDLKDVGLSTVVI